MEQKVTGRTQKPVFVLLTDFATSNRESFL